jgi:phosphate starvation-inducible PhoH-like protein
LAEDIQARVPIRDAAEAMSLFGKHDEHMRAVEKVFSVRISMHGNDVLVEGGPETVRRVENILHRLLEVLRGGNPLNLRDVTYVIRLAQEDEDVDLADLFQQVIITTARGKQIRPKTIGQRKYVDAMNKNDIVFGIGPAGTGKTYLAMAMAVSALRNREVNRIVLTRPAIEAGERLGFLPGDLQEKVSPYLRPLYDALYDIMGVDVYQKHMEKGIIEIAPLAYMRGRTLDDSYIILDEAQNTTPEQMKMFLTRLGFGSKAVITGDLTQIDLPRGQYSGLSEACEVLQGVEGLAVVRLSDRDVVRHTLVQKIVLAYDAYEKKNPRPERRADKD